MYFWNLKMFLFEYNWSDIDTKKKIILVIRNSFKTNREILKIVTYTVY